MLLISLGSVFLWSYFEARKIEKTIVAISSRESGFISLNRVEFVRQLQGEICSNQPNTPIGACRFQYYYADDGGVSFPLDEFEYPKDEHIGLYSFENNRYWAKSIDLSPYNKVGGYVRFVQPIPIDFILRLIIPLAILFILLPWVLLAVTLRPLQLLSRQAERINPEAPEPELFSAKGPAEVRQLSQRLKETLSTIKKHQASLALQQQSERQRYKWFHHELTQPNAVALAELDLLSSDLTDLSAEEQQGLQVIQRSLEETGFILSALSQYLYLDELRIDNPQVFDLYDICLEAAKLYPGIKLDLSQGIYAKGSPFFIRRVLQNLLHNAHRVVNNPQDISLKLETKDDSAFIHVCDKGPGIPEDVLPLLFKGQINIERKKGGRGIGLWYAKYLIDLHGGEISVRSQQGEGACFTIRL
ncbi:MAG: HAMP domain-containing sensor histidine kinase [Deinococcales bacterium]